ncbi:MAG: tRNA (adenosine(37)-N6)-dimethylallyltransferase MiaA [Saprospiraceae bacterium]|nr:tRNA (adenosine(37)-N6)-dimethylallyltransferase MiaA [Saprospiraceae bacterium]
MSDSHIIENKFLIIITGPTAVGKTAASLHLAKTFGAEIFSADSRQIFAELSIGTAKPGPIDMDNIPHHFIGHKSIHDHFSAGHFESEFTNAMSAYFKSKDIAIVTGGTGLYLRAIMEGLDDFPDIPNEVIQFYNDGFETNGMEWLRAELQEQDPAYYLAVDLSNHRRIMRALCVCKVAGRPFSSFLTNVKKPKLPYTTIGVLLELPRQELYDRINKRVDDMMSAGLLHEARNVYPYKGLASLETVGYRELFDFFDGHTDLDIAVNMIKQNSRRYAKRQMTWFRKYGDWTTFHPEQISEIEGYIRSEISTSHR